MLLMGLLFGSVIRICKGYASCLTHCAGCTGKMHCSDDFPAIFPLKRQSASRTRSG